MVLLKRAWLMLSGTATAQVRTTVLGQDDSLAAYIPYFFREAPPAIRLPEVDVDAAPCWPGTPPEVDRSVPCQENPVSDRWG